jgi:hypothetical protein
MSVEFTLEKLTPRQMVLADIIWACRDFADVQKFIKTLPTGELRDEAYSIVELMKMAAIEQCYDGIAEPTEAKDILNQFKL